MATLAIYTRKRSRESVPLLVGSKKLDFNVKRKSFKADTCSSQLLLQRTKGRPEVGAVQRTQQE